MFFTSVQGSYFLNIQKLEFFTNITTVFVRYHLKIEPLAYRVTDKTEKKINQRPSKNRPASGCAVNKIFLFLVTKGNSISITQLVV